VSGTQAGGKLGKYEIRGTLGRGAMGVVYDGWDPIIARRVAIKTVKIPDPSDTEAVEELARFRREAQAAGRLTHPNIVGIYDYGEDGDVAYIVMEFVDGPTLKSLLKDQARMALPDIVRVIDDVLAGLAFSHARGIVHRDIKPANVMISSDGRAKIADFGIARIESSSMTQAGTVMGTPAYMSPEQFMGQTVDSRTDLYSTGVLLYELLTGEKPFDGGMTAIMHKALHTEPPKPSQISVTAPPAMDAVVARAMAKRPEQRFPNAEAFAAAMREAAAAPALAAGPEDSADATMVSAPPRAAAPRPAPARPATAAAPAPAAPKQGGAPVAPIAAGLVLAAALGGAGYWWFAMRPAEAPTPPPVIATAPPSPPGPAVLPPPTTPDPAPTPQPIAPAPAVQPPVATPAPPTPAPATPAPAVQPPVAAPAVQPPVATPAPAVQAPIATPAPAVQPPVVAAPAPQPQLPAPAPQPQPQPPAPVAQPPSPPPVVVQPQPQVRPEPPPVATATPAPVQQAAPAQPAPKPEPPAPTTPGPLALAPVAPPPVVQPQPQPQPVVLPLAAQVRNALAAALPTLSCSLVSGTVTADRVTVRGVVGRGAPERALRDSVTSIAGAIPRDWRVNSFDAPFCSALDALRPAAQPFGSGGVLQIALANNATRLRDGELVTVALTAPDFPAYVMVSFLVHDGTLMHLHPTPTDPARAIPPGSTLRLGDPSIGGPAWAVGPPYGSDMIIAIASSAPLFDRPRPDDEDTAAYLRDLRAAIAAARQRGVRLAADAWVLETAPR
jgi:serine/threonine-protein kinase